MAIGAEQSSPLLDNQVEEEFQDELHQHKYQVRYHSKLTNIQNHLNRAIMIWKNNPVSYLVKFPNSSNVCPISYSQMAEAFKRFQLYLMVINSRRYQREILENWPVFSKSAPITYFRIFCILYILQLNYCYGFKIFYSENMCIFSHDAE